MTKEEIVSDCTFGVFDEYEIGITGLGNAMEIYAKQEAILFSEFKKEYQTIESMNVRHDQIENHNGDIYSWKGDSDDVIWDAYKKGEKIKRYFEK